MVAMFTPTNQIKYTNIAVVRQKKNGKKFEIACYRNKILGWLSGIETNLDDVIQSFEIFKDVSTGSIAQRQDLIQSYNTDNIEEIIKEILKKGSYQMSDLERKNAYESLFKQIASKISLIVISPTTSKPYPQSIIEKALKELHFRVTLNTSIKKQIREAIQQIQTILPIIETKILLSIIIINDIDGNKLLNQCLQYSDQIISDTIINDDRKILIVIKHQYINKIKKLTESTQNKSLVKLITIENNNYL